MDDRTKLQETGVFTYETLVELRYRTSGLRSELSNICARLPKAEIDSDEEEETLLDGIKALSAIDKKLGAAITEKRRIFFLETGNNPAAAEG